VIDPVYILLPLIALAAFVLKAATGFGPAIVVIALGSLLMAPQEVIATSSILDMTAGALLLAMDRPRGRLGFWLPLSAAIVSGAVIGGLLIVTIPERWFDYIFSVAILVLGLWFILGRGRAGDNGGLVDELPPRCGAADTAMTFFGGFCGGLFGISGPPILWQFGRKFAKHAFRQTLVPIFFAAALARTVTYCCTSLVTAQVLLYVLASLPGLLFGIYLGNKVFFRLSEVWFNRVAGVVLIVIALQLAF
jgi:uncharacterized membrane protein YfcA